jgi:polyhydroxyalkanoate synthesis regulator phasin
MNDNIVLYKNGEIELNISVGNETIWLTQKDIVEIFNKDQSVISRHINNILKDKEVDEKSNMQKMHIAFVNNLIKNVKHNIVLIDNYIDDSILTMLSKNQDVKVTLYTKTISKKLKLDIDKYNAQYNNLNVQTTKKFHDRFLLIDNEAYHIGASLKDLGKKIFAFSKINISLLKKELEQ